MNGVFRTTLMYVSKLDILCACLESCLYTFSHITLIEMESLVMPTQMNHQSTCAVNKSNHQQAMEISSIVLDTNS